MLPREPETITAEIFRSVKEHELKEKKYMSEWIVGSDSKPSKKNKVGIFRPWTKSGSVYKNYSYNFYNCLIWYKSDKIKYFRALAWTLNKEVIERVAEKMSHLIDLAIKNPESLIKYDNENKTVPLDYLSNYNPKFIAEYTAVDDLFQNITNKKIETILDFGSGIGRQSFKWNEKGIFYSIDANETLYLLQNRIYSFLFPDKFKEYFYKPKDFTQKSLQESNNLLVHLPTWKLDLIPSNSLDLIICVQVLNEINEKTLRYVIKQFSRVAKKNCLIYVRDMELGYTPGHNIRAARLLLKEGFELVFKYNGLEHDIEGTPRLFVLSERDNYNLLFRIIRFFSYPSKSFSRSIPFIKKIKIIIKLIIIKIRDFGLPL